MKRTKTHCFNVWIIISILLASVSGYSINVFAQGEAESAEGSEPPISVKSIRICEKVENRDPVNEGAEFKHDSGNIACHTVLSCNLDDQTIHHLWYMNDALMAKVTLKIGKSLNWRTWSTKNLVAESVGKWKVVVQTEAGDELASFEFEVK